MAKSDLEPSAPPRRLPRIIRYLGWHCLLGAIMGCLFAALLVTVNIGGLKDLLQASEAPYLPLVMLYVACALTFASLVMGVAVMVLDENGDPDL